MLVECNKTKSGKKWVVDDNKQRK